MCKLFPPLLLVSFPVTSNAHTKRLSHLPKRLPGTYCPSLFPENEKGKNEFSQCCCVYTQIKCVSKHLSPSFRRKSFPLTDKRRRERTRHLHVKGFSPLLTLFLLTTAVKTLGCLAHASISPTFGGNIKKLKEEVKNVPAINLPFWPYGQLTFSMQAFYYWDPPFFLLVRLGLLFYGQCWPFYDPLCTFRSSAI